MPTRIVQLKKPNKANLPRPPVEIEDTTYALWCDLYRVKMNDLESRSIQDVKMFGVRSSGNKTVDEALRNQHIYRWISIERMVDYDKQMCLMGFSDINDLKKIYQALYRHMLSWQKSLIYGLNVANAPIEDLIAMDVFSDKIWTKICYHVTNSDIARDTAELFQKDTRLDIRALFGAKFLSDIGMGTDNTDAKQFMDRNGRIDPYKLPKRQKFSEFFESKLCYIRRD